MREIDACEGRTHFSALLDEVAHGETIIITRHGRPVARLTASEEASREATVAAASTLRRLRRRTGWATTADILQMRDEARS